MIDAIMFVHGILYLILESTNLLANNEPIFVFLYKTCWEVKVVASNTLDLENHNIILNPSYQTYMSKVLMLESHSTL